jgi:hypothetical protein
MLVALHESDFTKLAFDPRRMSALPRNPLGRLLLGRWSESASSQPGFAHSSGRNP